MVHRFWDCAIGDCHKSAAIDIGSCERCTSMFCAGHITSEEHNCARTPLDGDAWLAAQTAELSALANKVNEAALLQRAHDLSGGKRCHLDPSDPLGRRLMGGMHVHRELRFDDGTVWLVRMLRENHTSFDDATSNQILLSECATLVWLAAHVDSIPAPRLHGYGLRGDSNNAVGVAYMLIDKLPGEPLDIHSATAEQRAKVLDQWAGMLCALAQKPLDKVGSLQFAPGSETKTVVGPVAGDRTGTLPCTLGPFSDARAFYTAWADTHLDLISDGQLFFANPVDAYLMFRWIKEQVIFGSWFKKAESKDLHSGPFFLRHVDDKGDHLLVDDDYNITGVIDWTFARTAPAYETFAPALVTADTAHLFAGIPGICESDKILEEALKHRGAPYCYFETDPMRRLLLGLGVGLGLTRKETTDIFGCLVKTCSGGSQTVPKWSLWRDWYLAECRHRDTRLAALLPPSQQPPRFTTCGFPETCSSPGVHGSSCQVCKLHLCASHRQPNYHTCKPIFLDDDAWEQSITDEIEALLAQVNVAALERRASSLRRGIACKFQRGKHLGSDATMGCANYHAWLVFDDGVRWLARIPRITDGSDLPTDLINHMVASEYATLRFIENEMGRGQTQTSVPAPRAYGFGLLGDPNNTVGIPYLLEEALPGRPFSASDAIPEQKAYVYSQYADILDEISRHPVDQACSLVPSSSSSNSDTAYTPGPIASDRFITLGQHGPYPDALSYFASVADLHLDLIADRQIFVDYPRVAAVFYRLLRDRAAPALSTLNKDLNFYLKHVDDKGDHILVDDNYKITGVIDWQFARFVPAVEAFGPSLVTADMADMYNGNPGTSADDGSLAAALALKENQFAGVAAGSELARRFHFGLASGLSRAEALAMVGAVLELLDIEHGDVGSWVDAEWLGAKDSDPRVKKIDITE